MGAMKWFGPPLNVPYEESCEHVDVPVGDVCLSCEADILPGENGMMIWYSGSYPNDCGYRSYHRKCFLNLVIPDLVRAQVETEEEDLPDDD